MQISDLRATLEIFIEFMPYALGISVILFSIGLIIRIIPFMIYSTFGYEIQINFERVKPKEYKLYLETYDIKSFCKGCGKEVKSGNNACSDCIAFAKLILS